MAAEVPVCDVLCEAMEYLSKLGSNLRTRSENLREKKIRKDKLKNTHAVQKAANKVLLICELSKKSLENVETGVRKVLSVVDAAQASTSVGGKSSSTQPEIRADFHYFKYKSQKLRIQKRVPLKHYTSVKVLARKMPISMQDDYPVYYDCRLYRLRKRKDRTHYDTKSSSSERDSMPLKGVSSDNRNERRTSTCVQQKQNTDDTVECLPDINESVSRNIKKTSNSDNEVNSAKVCRTDYNKTKKFDSENITSTEQLPGKLKESETTGSKKHSRYSESSKSQKDENKEQLKHVRVIESSESDEEKQKEEELKERDEDIGDSSTTRNVPAEGESSSSLFENVSKKRKLNKSDQNIQSNDKQQVEKNVNVNENSDQKQDSEDLPNKPMIKCVNINKLLKPDVILNDRTCATDKGGKPSTIIIEKSTDRTKNEKSEQRQQEDDDYWTQKRKEVKAFKSKSFNVIVTRLPKLSVNYLHIHNLKKITHNESVICQEINDFENQSGDSSNTKTKTNTSRKTHSGNRDITCLLNNSYSDDNYTNLNNYLTIESEKVKDSLLNESDSDNQGKSADDLSRNSVKEDSTFIVKSKNKGNSDSQKDSNKNHPEPNIDSAITKEAEKVKDALLNESDSELQENFTDKPSQNSVTKYTKKTNKPEGVKNKEESDNQNLSPVNNDSESNNLPHSSNEGETIFDSSENELNTGYNQNKIIDEIQKSLEKDTESNIKTNNLVDETKHVKEALLNESDSDHQENVSKAILNYSKGLSDNTNESRVFEKDSRTRDIRVNDQSKDIDVDKDSNSHNSIENYDGAQKKSDAQSVENEIRTEMCNKELSPSTNPENIKSSLLNDSSNDIPKTPLSQRKKRKISVTSQSKRKHIMESMHAKKMLLTYSSSSDTDDEQLRNTLKDIKKALLKGLSDEEDDLKDLKSSHHCKNSHDANSSSSEDLIKQVKEYMTRELTPDSSQIKKKPNKTTKTESDLNNQAKSNMDDDSTSSSGKVRSSNS